MNNKSKDDLQEDGENCLNIPNQLLKKWEINMSDIEIQKEYFSSTYSTIYIGIQKSTNTVVCVKQFNDGEKESAMQDFQNEFQVLSVLKHFAISQFIGATLSPKFSIITQFMSGGSLYSRLHSKQSYTKLHSTQLSIIALGIAYGMTYLHSNNIIHRDLKSLNILLDANSLPTISDFGTSVQKNRFLTGGVGTAQWMAPEVLNSQTYDQKVDVYSYGMILWEMLTGDIPFNGLTPMEVALAVVTQKIRPKIPFNCPKNLARLIQICWDDDPSKRPEFRRIVNILESCSITFSGTDLKEFQSYIRNYSPTKRISIIDDREDMMLLSVTKSGPLQSSYLSSTQNLMINLDTKTIEKLIDNIQRSTECLSKLIQIAETPSLIIKLSNYPQIMVYLSNHLKTSNRRNNSSDITKIIHLFSLLLHNDQLKESFFKNNCQNSVLIVLSENTTQQIPKLLDVLTIIVENDSKCKLNGHQLNRISSYLLCVDMNVRQTAANLLLTVVEKKSIASSFGDFASSVENLLVNLYPELNNSTFLKSIVSLLLILIEHSEKVKKQIVSLYGTEKVVSLLASKSFNVVDESVVLAIILCESEVARAQTCQAFVDVFPVALDIARESDELVAKLLKLAGLYFRDRATFECVAASEDFIPAFVGKCIKIERDDREAKNLALTMKMLYVLCSVEATSPLLFPFAGDVMQHLSTFSEVSIPVFAALSISALLSKSDAPNEAVRDNIEKLRAFSEFAFKGQNEVKLAAFSLFGVLSNLRDTQYVCASLALHTSIIHFLSSDNFLIVQMAVRVLISISSSKFAGELANLHDAIKPLFLLCDVTSYRYKKFGVEPLVCIANILVFPGNWRSAVPFIAQLFEMYDIDELAEIALLVTFRIVSAAQFCLSAGDGGDSLFGNEEVVRAFVEKAKKLCSLNNDALISVMLCFAEVKSSRAVLKETQVVDTVDEIIFQCAIDDVRRPKLLRIHSYLSRQE